MIGAGAARAADVLFVPERSAAAVWAGLARHSVLGARYLDERTGAAAELEGRGLVRYLRDAPAVALRHLAVGAAIVNVVRRTLPRDVAAGAPRVCGLRGCGTSGALVGNVDDIAAGRDVVLVEGVIDSLVATLAWPHAVIAGAHGAGRMAEVAAEVAARAARARSRMLLVVDNDPTGITHGIAAARAAVSAGLRVGADLLVVDIGDAKDLADAWSAGWRP